MSPTPGNVYGVLPLIIWALLLIVAVEYIGFILRADNKGEGGILALMALVLQRQHRDADTRARGARRKVRVEPLGQGFFRVSATFGFMETPNVPMVLAMARPSGLRAIAAQTSYFLGRERLLPFGGSPMARWRKTLFVFMSRNAQSATEFFGLPPNRVVELGAQIEF